MRACTRYDYHSARIFDFYDRRSVRVNDRRIAANDKSSAAWRVTTSTFPPPIPVVADRTVRAENATRVTAASYGRRLLLLDGSRPVFRRFPLSLLPGAAAFVVSASAAEAKILDTKTAAARVLRTHDKSLEFFFDAYT